MFDAKNKTNELVHFFMYPCSYFSSPGQDIWGEICPLFSHHMASAPRLMIPQWMLQCKSVMCGIPDKSLSGVKTKVPQSWRHLSNVTSNLACTIRTSCSIMRQNFALIWHGMGSPHDCGYGIWIYHCCLFPVHSILLTSTLTRLF